MVHDYLPYHRSEFAGEQVPTLYEALDVCKKLNLLMFLELKEDAEKVSIVFFVAMLIKIWSLSLQL